MYVLVVKKAWRGSMLVGERENSPAFVKTSACVNSADGTEPKTTPTAGHPPSLLRTSAYVNSADGARPKSTTTAWQELAWQGREEGSAFVKTTARQGGVSAKTMAGGKMYLAKRLIDIILAS
jgi:hypothetical protein